MLFALCCVIVVIWLACKLVGAGISKTGELLQRGRNHANVAVYQRNGADELAPPNESERIS